MLLLMLDFGTEERRVGLVGYFRGGTPLVPRAILDDELPIIPFFLFSLVVGYCCCCIVGSHYPLIPQM